MGLVGAFFVGGTGALAFLLAAEVVAATAAVSEAALIYVARHRNLMISFAMVGFQVALSFALIFALDDLRPLLGLETDTAGNPIPLRESKFAAMGPAIALALALGFASILKSRLLARILGAPVSGWRWPLVWAAAVAAVVGYGVTSLPPSYEWVELSLGIPLILLSYGVVIWYKGFTREDRVLFRLKEA